MKTISKSVLLKTSSNTDVQDSGGVLSITGLLPVNKKDISSISQTKYRAEVAQVVTIGATSYTPVGSTTYEVVVYDPNRKVGGATESIKRYAYTTTASLVLEGASAALQREYISLQLVAKINADASNHAVAVTAGSGNGFTVTDDGGYYPVKAAGMSNTLGANTVKIISGYATNNIAITTAAVYSVGVGATLASMAPVTDPMNGGNLISGTFSAPGTFTQPITYAVSGQRYDAFTICDFIKAEAHQTSGDQVALNARIQTAWVDNGAGTATTNLAGFLTFEREMHKEIYYVYKDDKCTVAEFFDQNFVIQGPLGAVPVTTTSITNKFITPYGLLNHVNIGAQTIVAPAMGATGLLIEQDAAATEGAQYSPDLGTLNSQQFVVGKTAFMMVCKNVFTTVANVVFHAGFRNKEAFNVAFGSYTNLATVGTGAAGTYISTSGVLSSAAAVTTTSASALAVTAVENTFIVYVAIDGTVTCYANGSTFPIYSAGTTPLVFAAGTILVPFFQYTNLNSAAAVINMREFVAIATDRAVVI